MSKKSPHTTDLINLLAPLTLASVAVIGSNTSAQAVNINYSYAPGTTLEQMIGFEMAGGIWSSHLADNVSVNIYVQTTNDLPTNVIGGALPGISAKQRYDTWRNSIIADKKSADDNSVVNNLQDDQDKFTAIVDGYKVDNNYYLNMTRANAKALGMVNGSDSALDGYVLMSNLQGTPVSWNYNYQNNSIPTNNLDFLSVGIHEVGHILGLVSGVDRPGWLTQKTQYDDAHKSDYYASLTGKLDHVTPLDLFRFSSKSIAAGGLAQHWIDMSIGGNPYFSVNGGQTALGYFASGEDTSLGGDGEQASHWKQNDNPLGIMDPVLSAGQRTDISTLDRGAMDAIGWDLGTGAIDLATLELQAKQRLAARLGVTVAWLEANPLEAALLLTLDRTQDVGTMIQESKIYEWGYNCQATNTCWKQEGLWQNFHWQTLNSSPSNPQAKSVPEPTSLAGLLGIALLGIGSLFKSRHNK
jgi:hypothetical protein